MSQGQSMIVVNSVGANIRKTPGLGGEIIEALQTSSVLTVNPDTEQTADGHKWLQIVEGPNAKDATCWVALDLLGPDPAGGAIPQGLRDFRAQSSKIGLPIPFSVLPAQGIDTAPCNVNGFGPNSFALHRWPANYTYTDGMHSGIDYIIGIGTPILALSDGVIVGTGSDWRFIPNVTCQGQIIADKSLILWCFHPENDEQGRRQMSNVLVAYGHLSDNTIVRRHDVVTAGQVIARSGFPACDEGNNHLHLEVHLLSGDNALPRPATRRLLSDYQPKQPFSNQTPFNPILFFNDDLVKYHIRRKSGLGATVYPTLSDLSGGYTWPAPDFFTVANYQYNSANIVWNLRDASSWASHGIYDLPSELARIADFTPFNPYPTTFLGH